MISTGQSYTFQTPKTAGVFSRLLFILLLSTLSSCTAFQHSHDTTVQDNMGEIGERRHTFFSAKRKREESPYRSFGGSSVTFACNNRIFKNENPDHEARFALSYAEELQELSQVRSAYLLQNKNSALSSIIIPASIRTVVRSNERDQLHLVEV